MKTLPPPASQKKKPARRSRKSAAPRMERHPVSGLMVLSARPRQKPITSEDVARAIAE